MFYICLVFVMLSLLFIAALWSPALKRLISCLSFVMLNCAFVTFPLLWYPGSGLVLGCIDSRSLPPFLLMEFKLCSNVYCSIDHIDGFYLKT